MSKALFITGMLGLSVVLGATVFRDSVAWAAQTVDAHVTNLDGNGNIRVHEEGTAAVGLSPTANTVKIDPSANRVEVVNAPGKPLFTSSAGAPFQESPFIRVVSGEDSQATDVPIPTGERAVITFVAAHCAQYTDGSTLHTIEPFVVGDGGTYVFVPLRPTPYDPPAGAGFVLSLGDVQTTLYATDHVHIQLNRYDTDGEASCRFTVTGYLTNAS